MNFIIIITLLFLCIEYYTCFVRNDEIKMSNIITGERHIISRCNMIIAGHNLKAWGYDYIKRLLSLWE